MANMHVLERSGTFFRLALHVAVPATNNAAGLSWRTALLRSGLSDGVTLLPDGDGTLGTISAAEKALVVSGALIEDVVSLDVTQGGAQTTNAQIGAYLDEFYAAYAAGRLLDLQRQLQHYGRTR